MTQLETWFKNFFITPYIPRWGNKEEIEIKRLSLWTIKFLEISWYFSIVSFFIWLIGFSSIHLTQHMKSTTIIEKIFFFVSPTVWDKYFLTQGGGFFDSLRRSEHWGETIFIYSGVALVILFIATLILSLLNIAVATKEGLKELKFICYSLCFPMLGGIFAFFLLFHFLMLNRNKEIFKAFGKVPLINTFLNFYLNFFINRRKNNLKKASFVNINFLNSSKKIKVA
ncbi:hypothetical protein [Mycoplasma parvum]|uniref:Uncharacterized protein n=1 Tax=Mycoplasma parvum str. Indiana TaxID=1403316 RepID=U5NGC2_9MOLU|nr:hypothetical protein [Mycoplasma parvum]AGX89249.1 hypothetical protein PRV_02580 [Mycoplasma parvum str. Indiana]